MSTPTSNKKALPKPKLSSFAFANVGLSDDQAKAIWDSLRLAIEEIHQGNASKLRFEELYRNAYTLVLHKQGDMLYHGVVQCVTDRLVDVSRRVSTASNDNLLDSIVSDWEHHKLIMGMIRDILMYLDKTFCKQARMPPVYDMGLQLFREHVLKHPEVNSRLRSLLLKSIDAERGGEQIDRMLMKNAIGMLVEVGIHSLTVYEQEFEREFLNETRKFYLNESQAFILQNSVPDYLRKIEQRLIEEDNRADVYLDRSTKSKVRRVLIEELIKKYAQRLVNDEKSGCRYLFDLELKEDLSRMYSLFLREEKMIDYLRECMSAIVKEKGAAIVSDKDNMKNPFLFVQAVLDCRTKFTAIVEAAFRNDRTFVKALKDALEYFINLDNRSAQYLSLYIDDLLKKKVKESVTSDAEMEDRLNSVLSIFRYLHEKDVFEDLYKQHLAKRLLEGTTVNSEIERSMIVKLKAESGHQFTSRLEGMFKDIELSKQIMQDYQSTLTDKEQKTELNVTVLTTGFWPNQTSANVTLPADAAAVSEHFRRYYVTKHSGRRLTWQPALGTAELRCSFDEGRKELIVPSYMMCILMLYNHKETFTYAEILKLTGIPEFECSRHVLSLAHPQVKVLKKTPNVKQLAEDHKFTWNRQYSSRLYRNRINALSKQSLAANPTPGAGGASSSASGLKDGIPENVLEARKSMVEAAVVRIMKARKELEHNLLVAEVTKQLSSKFTADPQFIKKRIELLIEKEYLARDQENRKMYKYLA